MNATPTEHTLPFRPGDFKTLADALDYAAQGSTGCNFYAGNGKRYASLPYAELRTRAIRLAKQLHCFSLERGMRVALIAETSPEFVTFFFACQYAGLIPVPLPAVINLGGQQAYVNQLRTLLTSCGATIAVSPPSFVTYLRDAAEGLNLRFIGTPEALADLPQHPVKLQPHAPSEVAYIQYTSGSTNFPRGVMITQQAVMSNLSGIIQHGIKITPGDRFFSWLPFYHDMGLVGLVLVPMASQRSVDYLGTREFATRPRQWLALMDKTKATISFSPPFGYELCARRLRQGEANHYDLRHWRIAGVGAEMIRPETALRFADALTPSGFDKNAFLACYGMAECALAVSFAPLIQGFTSDCIDRDHFADHNEAMPLSDSKNSHSPTRSFVNCGIPLPEHEIQIRGEDGNPRPDRHPGVVYIKGPSLMSGYLSEPDLTRQTLAEDGWLNTGDMGYTVDGSLFITGRKKDLIIINGRNIWPQDLEYLAEQRHEVRMGDALAFSFPTPEGSEIAVLVVQCRESDATKRANLVSALQALVRAEFGIECHVELVPLHTLPRTSSGKLSRSKARQNFMDSTSGMCLRRRRVNLVG